MKLLRNALLANAAFSGLSGITLLVFSGALGGLIGVPSNALAVTGAVLLVFALGLVRNGRRAQVNLAEARLAVVSDWAWVVGSAVLIALVPLTAPGRALVVGVAAVVAAFALAQAVGIRRAR